MQRIDALSLYTEMLKAWHEQDDAKTDADKETAKANARKIAYMILAPTHLNENQMGDVLGVLEKTKASDEVSS